MADDPKLITINLDTLMALLEKAELEAGDILGIILLIALAKV